MNLTHKVVFNNNQITMLNIFFLIAGLYMIFKKEVKVSSKRLIKGKTAQKIGLIFLIPVILSYISKLISSGSHSVILAYISLVGYGIAILFIFYFVFFYKQTNNDKEKIL